MHLARLAALRRLSPVSQCDDGFDLSGQCKARPARSTHRSSRTLPTARTSWRYEYRLAVAQQIAQAKAEERRAMAVALEQEMRARVVEAEAEVPRAMAEAFRQGNLGIMDYYRMKNIQADSTMRESIADGTNDEPTPPVR